MYPPAVSELQYVSVVSKVCSELQNHIDVNDKDLAEFVIHLAKENPKVEKFQEELQGVGASFQPG